MPDFSHENSHGRTTGIIIAGVDEVGRGPLAGPVVAAAVIWPTDIDHSDIWSLIDDSKKLKAARRAELAAQIQQRAIYAIGIASVEEIDTINILQSSVLAMRRAVEQLPNLPGLCLIDGNYTPKQFPAPVKTLVGGDGLSLSIAAASIIAKEYRDQMMRDLAAEHPHYGWETNAGYGSPKHMGALKTHGATIHHRRSFAPVRACLEQKSAA